MYLDMLCRSSKHGEFVVFLSSRQYGHQFINLSSRVAKYETHSIQYLEYGGSDYFYIHIKDAGLIKNLSEVLFKEFLFAFEIVSILLLAALVGAIFLGKKEENESEIKNLD